MLKKSDKRIHVLHLIGSTGLYGAERWILALMRAADPERVRFTLANLADRRNEKSEVVSAALARGLDAFDFYTGGAFNPLAAVGLARWARNKKIQIIHGHGFKSDAVGLLASRMAGCRMITTPHGWSMEEDRKLRFYENLDRMMFRFMDAVCPLSSDLEQELEGRARREGVRLIFNGVDVEEVRESPPATRADSDSYLIGYVGQLINRKNLSTLLAAVKLLCVDSRNVRLMIIGDGPRRESLREEAARLGIDNRTTFLGFRADAIRFVKTFDVFVLPSLLEGIPRCLMEAMAAGIPVISSDIPGNRMIVKHGETGLLFDACNSDDLAGKIVRLMENTAEAKAMAAMASGLIEQEFSSRRMAEEYTALYEELLAEVDLGRSLLSSEE